MLGRFEPRGSGPRRAARRSTRRPPRIRPSGFVLGADGALSGIAPSLALPGGRLVAAEHPENRIARPDVVVIELRAELDPRPRQVAVDACRELGAQLGVEGLRAGLERSPDIVRNDAR